MMDFTLDETTEFDEEARRAEDERRAMEALQMRLQEREDQRRPPMPTTEAVFPPSLMPGASASAGPVPNPQSPLPSPQAGDPGPPAISTSPQTPPPTAEASTNPETPTVTAGAQAAELRNGQQPQPQQTGMVNTGITGRSGIQMMQAAPIQLPEVAITAGAPSGIRGRSPDVIELPEVDVYSMPDTSGMGPGAALGGSTGLGDGSQVMRAAAARQPREATYDERLRDARDEDTRRRRIRGILMGLAALGGMRTIGSGGSMGGALPGLIAAGMVRRPNEEETFRANDERSREVQAEEERRRALMDRLEQQRAGQVSQDAYRQRQLDLQERRLAGDQADRQLRTGIALRENEREEDLLRPGSDVSGRERSALRAALRNQPREVQAAYPAEELNGLAALELRSIRDQLERGGRARTMAGNGGGTSGVAGGIQGVENVPAALIAAQAQLNGEDPQNPSEATRAAAQYNWSRMKPRDRAELALDSNAQSAARILARHLDGYEQAQGGAISDAQHDEARQALLAQEEFDAAINQAVRAAERIENMSAGEQALARGGDLVGVEVNDAVSDFNDARTAIIATMNRMAGGGTMDQAEFQRWQQQLPSISDFRSVAGATRRLRAAQRRIAELTQARVRAAGYRQTSEGQQQRSGERGRVRIQYRDAQGRVRRTRPIPAGRVDEARAAIEQSGGQVMQ